MTTEGHTESKADALEERLVEFAVGIIPIANRLSESFSGRHLAGQIIRSGTSAAPNYAEPRSAESRADFIHKLRIAIKELNEAAIWLRVITKGDLLPGMQLSGLSRNAMSCAGSLVLPCAPRASAPLPAARRWMTGNDKRAIGNNH